MIQHRITTCENVSTINNSSVEIMCTLKVDRASSICRLFIIEKKVLKSKYHLFKHKETYSNSESHAQQVTKEHLQVKKLLSKT